VLGGIGAGQSHNQEQQRWRCCRTVPSPGCGSGRRRAALDGCSSCVLRPRLCQTLLSGGPRGDPQPLCCGQRPGGAARSHHALPVVQPQLRGKSAGGKTASPEQTKLPGKELLSGSTSISRHGPSNPRLRRGQGITQEEEQQGKPPSPSVWQDLTRGPTPETHGHPHPPSPPSLREAGEQGPAGRAVPARDEWRGPAAGCLAPAFFKTS